MDVLIRENLQGGSGFQEFQDTEVQCDKLGFGSAPDQAVQLLGDGVKAQEAVITTAGGSVSIKGLGKSVLQVNGEPQRSANLSEGDRITLAGNEIHILSAPAGFDLAIELTRSATVDASAFENAFVTSVDQTGWSMRKLSWGLTFLVLLVSIMLPILSLVMRDEGEKAPAGIPSDALWTSGPLHSVHELAAKDDCQTCHTDLFVKVQDEACVACHEELHDHISAELMESHPENQIRCATCHREHNEPRPTLIVQSDPLCTDCHASEPRMAGSDDIGLVSGFSSELHPEFRAHLLKPAAMTESGELPWKLEVASVKDASEQSNLKFPHDVHLDPEKVQKPSGDESLGCADCHQLNNDREHFASITMEKHCASCHELTFDPTFPERQLPHGKPEEVIFTLEGHYLKIISDPTYKPAETSKRRRPDRKSKRVEVCNEATYDCALQKAERDTDDQFSRQGCVSCHEVSVDEGQSLYQRYSVLPVRLTGDYFPHNVFDHGSHQIMKYPDGEGSLSGAEACNSCHEASGSEQSTDLLMADLDNCSQCHGSMGTQAVVELQCITCHLYHPLQSPNPEAARNSP